MFENESSTVTELLVTIEEQTSYRGVNFIMKLSVIKKFHFCYGHYLPKYDGKCKNIHGHNSVLEVEVSGTNAYEYDGMVIDFVKLKSIVSPVLEKFDHTFLNNFMDVPTAENIAQFFYIEIQKRLPIGNVLERIKITETEDSWAEVKR